jgi:tRNA-Thr(GGU) m(6)t(6)A37 methyltransferase TsaA
VLVLRSQAVTTLNIFLTDPQELERILAVGSIDSVSSYVLEPIGTVSSTIVDPSQAPNQGDEGAPAAWIEFTHGVRTGLADIAVGDELFVLTWLHLARRDVLQLHPRGDTARPLTGVFSTRSPDRPNPIGLHHVTVVAVENGRIRVSDLEAVDGTPVVDVKPVLGPRATR